MNKSPKGLVRNVVRGIALVAVSAVGLASILASNGGGSDNGTTPVIPDATAVTAMMASNFNGTELSYLTLVGFISNNIDTWTPGGSALIDGDPLCGLGGVLVTSNDADASNTWTQGDTIVIDYNNGSAPCVINPTAPDETTTTGLVTATLTTNPPPDTLDLSFDSNITFTVTNGPVTNSQGNVNTNLVFDRGTMSAEVDMSGGPLTVTVNGKTETLSDIDLHSSISDVGGPTETLTVTDGSDTDSNAMSMTSAVVGTLMFQINTAFVATLGGDIVPSQFVFTARHDQTPVYCIKATRVAGGDPTNPTIQLDTDSGCDGSIESTSNVLLGDIVTTPWWNTLL